MIQTVPENIEQIRERLRRCRTPNFASTVEPPGIYPILGRTSDHQIRRSRFSWTRLAPSGEDDILEVL